MCVLGGKKCSFFGVLCFLVTSVMSSPFCFITDEFLTTVQILNYSFGKYLFNAKNKDTGTVSVVVALITLFPLNR